MVLSQNISVILTGANIILLASLFIIYLRNYINIRSKFTLGLLLFAGIFLARDVGLAIYHMVTLTTYYGQYAIDDMFIHGAQLLAFLILLKITWK
ncbi:MAG: hypothetical protein GTN76_09020 [Candidatus Aenigmarchaeota archaeon]|nr:hypothetical protein [Candidatus Aenigmarchaeota archaeon]NIQ17729.1 hypothetical protein [Candidatus Aenigmarchaeota archaeon]NIS73041.1 hypothetical protein [Candidatus Aenigmarchaeota archaeon]